MEHLMDTPTWVVLVVLATLGLLIRLTIWYANVNSDRTSFKEFMKKIEGDVKEIKDGIRSIVKRLPVPPVMGSEFPLRLTEYAHSLAEDLETHRWAHEVSDAAIKRVKEFAGANAYDIQKTCLDFVKGFKNEQWVDFWKDCSYRRGIKIEVAYEILAIVLRDEISGRVAVQQVEPPGGFSLRAWDSAV